VHSIDGSGPVLEALAANPATADIVLVKRTTEIEIHGAASFLSVNPRISSWRLFLADVRRSLTSTSWENHPDVGPDATRTAVELILSNAQRQVRDRGPVGGSVPPRPRGHADERPHRPGDEGRVRGGKRDGTGE